MYVIKTFRPWDNFLAFIEALDEWRLVPRGRGAARAKRRASERLFDSFGIQCYPDMGEAAMDFTLVQSPDEFKAAPLAAFVRLTVDSGTITSAALHIDRAGLAEKYVADFVRKVAEDSADRGEMIEAGRDVVAENRNRALRAALDEGDISQERYAQACAAELDVTEYSEYVSENHYCALQDITYEHIRALEQSGSIEELSAIAGRGYVLEDRTREAKGLILQAVNHAWTDPEVHALVDTSLKKGEVAPELAALLRKEVSLNPGSLFSPWEMKGVLVRFQEQA